MTISSSPRFFWISLLIFSGICFVFASIFFSKAFPLIHLDLNMNRQQALTSAQVVAQQQNIGPTFFSQACAFATDQQVKTFVELEAGGKDAFLAMIQEELYQPYIWQIRLFKEFEKHEAIIYFTPKGTPYGFKEILSENEPGAHLDSDVARNIAEKQATTYWNVILNDYKLVESSKEKKPSGRIDHTFVYERPDKKIGEGFYRLRLAVSGDKLTEVKHLVKVPESFIRRYKQMRSANESIAWAAELIVLLLYIIGGCIVGLFFLQKKRFVVWRTPFWWGIGIALLLVLFYFNQFPLLWMSYDTAHTMQGFLLRHIVIAIIFFFQQALLFIVTFMAAESLTRKAFGHHPQFWSIWKQGSSHSLAILGRTVGGYLLVGIALAFVVLFYFIMMHYFNWWIPSEALINPNILATYVPWFASIAMAFKAGFWEECLFRAVPLASAALLGERFGKKKVWIIAAFILQALVFGAAHANYPAQPAYARLVELMVPSFMWGAVYIVFGLLPTIICHVMYDVILMSLPIFVSSAPGALTHKCIIILLSLTPIWIILYARIKKGTWTSLSPQYLNNAWQAPVAKEILPRELPKIKTVTFSTKKMYLIFVCGFCGLIAWFFATTFKQDALSLTINRNKAKEQAKQNLSHAITPDKPWRALTKLFYHYEQGRVEELQHRFIWQQGDKQLYQQLLGTYLTPPHWTVRFAQFEGDIVKRAEEYYVFIKQGGSIFRTVHVLPESQAGAQLSEEHARLIAYKAFKEKKLDPEQLEEISAVATQQPNRKDWIFTFSHPQIYPLEKGQARIYIAIAGDEVADVKQYIHVPEQWERNENNKQNMADIIKMLCSLLMMIIFVAGSVIAIMHWTAGPFSKKTFLITFCVLLVISILISINNWPSVIALFNTSEPFANQLFKIGTSIGFGALFTASALSLLLTFITSYHTPFTLAKTRFTYLIGIAIGTIIAGIQSIILIFIPTTTPLWANYITLNTFSPLIANVLSAIMAFIMLTVLLLLFCGIIDYGTYHWQRRKVPFATLFVFFGLLLNGLVAINDITIWITTGFIIGFALLIVYHCIIRFDHALLPLATGSYLLLQAIQQGAFNAYPGAIFATGTTVIIIGLLSFCWFKHLNK